MRQACLTLLALVVAARPCASQQFQQVGTGLPGPVVWSEGVEAFDADGDGRTDMLFANGNGFSSAGGALAPTLLMNQTSGGPITFANETAARLPAGFVQQAKSLTVLDADGDGDPDVVFANAFGNQPSILINDGTGHFADETARRLPAVSLSSFGVGFGDVDGDGDLDLVFADAGPSAFGAPGGMARLFVNDGTGHYANGSGQLNAQNKIGAQNAHLLDVDDDFDLDVVVDGKSPGQQLYVNDGTGYFTLQAGTLPAGTSNTYATGFSDLDNDDDMDGAYISLSGFDEGTARNNLGGSPPFTATTATLAGVNGDDDNDIVFLDADDDGIQDMIVGTLSGSREKLYLNAGTFANGSFVYQAGGFTALGDSTLDLAVGDFDGDGRYDVVTAQGESGSFTNRVYRNTGAVDTRPPRIGRTEPAPPRVPLSTIQAGGFVSRAWIQDATYKRGQTLARASLDVTAVKDGSTQDFSVPMRHVGGGIHRGAIQPARSPTGSVGMDVTFSVHATDPRLNASDGAPEAFRICGAESYGTAVPNSTGRAASLAGVNDPSIGANDFSVTISALPANTPGVLMLGTAKVLPGVPYGNGLRFVGGTLRRVEAAVADASGVAAVPLDFTEGSLGSLRPGETRYFQFRYADVAAGGAQFNASDALEITFCD